MKRSTRLFCFTLSKILWFDSWVEMFTDAVLFTHLILNRVGLLVYGNIFHEECFCKNAIWKLWTACRFSSYWWKYSVIAEDAIRKIDIYKINSVRVWIVFSENNFMPQLSKNKTHFDHFIKWIDEKVFTFYIKLCWLDCRFSWLNFIKLVWLQQFLLAKCK